MNHITEPWILEVADLEAEPEEITQAVREYLLPALDGIQDWIGVTPNDQFDDTAMRRARDELRDVLSWLRPHIEKHSVDPAAMFAQLNQQAEES